MNITPPRLFVKPVKPPLVPSEIGYVISAAWNSDTFRVSETDGKQIEKVSPFYDLEERRPADALGEPERDQQQEHHPSVSHCRSPAGRG